MQKFHVKIKANPVFPYYMQHRMDDTKLDVWEKKRGKIIERDDVSKEDAVRAEFHTYINAKGKYYMPASHIMGSLINGGKQIKSKVGNARRSMANIVAGMFFVRSTNGGEPEELPLGQRYEIDKRSAVNHNVKGRVITIRPKWKDWSTEFHLLVDNDTITVETIKDIIEAAGSNIGTGSYRPEHKGPFGRFIIEEFEKIE